MKHRYLLAVVGALSLGVSPGSGQVIGGEIVDEQSGAPLVGFRVFLRRQAGDSMIVLDSARTDSRGLFQMGGRGAGIYQLAFGPHTAALSSGPIDTVTTDTSMIARRYVVPITRISETTGFYEFQVEKPALPLSRSGAVPRYPSQLRSANIEGRVVATFVVGTNGRAELATFRAIESSHPAFTEAVRDALWRMRFTPASVAGIPVRQTVQQAFEFRLDAP